MATSNTAVLTLIFQARGPRQAAWPSSCCTIRLRTSYRQREQWRSTIRAARNSVTASNINKTYDEKKYLALYFKDDWKMTPKLTLNLGVRWDYFGPINETNGGQANFVPTALPAYGLGNPTFIVPATGKDPSDAVNQLHLRRISMLAAWSIFWRPTASPLT